MKEYDHSKIEKKWQAVWEKKKIFQAKDFKNKSASAKASARQEKFYGLIEFPYPSGDGLHVGHIRSNTAMDIICRKRRMEGYNVLYPIGWDAFGLPTENYAIKTGISPEKVTKKNTDTFRRQLKSVGFSFDWSREINTTDPKYYKWTQWIFLQFLKHDLAYKAKININWCPKCKIGLANEEVVNGRCDRCGTLVEKREKEQWMLRITKYADKLDKDLDQVDFLEKIKLQQRNWIGRSEGAEIKFNITSQPPLKLRGGAEHSEAGVISVFTTRPDTLFGVTYLVIAPEHELVKKLWPQIENKEEVKKYIDEVAKKSEMERTAEEKDSSGTEKAKSGIQLKGVSVINPANNEEVPVFLADYVLANYGTGAVMAVPAHDDRDFAFAKKYNLPIKEVISGGNISEKAFTDDGILVNSGEFDGMTSEEAREKITKKFGKKVEKFKLRDWVFSRQRYWGEPIPVVFCPHCAEASRGKPNAGWVPIPESKLPLQLPKVKNYQPTDTGESPLAGISKWVNTKCPKCGGKAKRETDTMPNWAGSSWYFLRYIDPKNSKKFADFKKLKYWMPVDWYNGGMEHTTLHLLYSRFWNKFLFDIGVVPFSEAYKKRTSHGMILAKNGEKMSKSRGNVINPDDIVKNYGADTLRLYEMFMGPFDQAISWNEENIIGVRRFLEKVWRVAKKLDTNSRMNANDTNKKEDNQTQQNNKKQNQNLKLESLLHKTIKKISEDIEEMNFNTAISSMMILVNEMESALTENYSGIKSASAQSYGVTKTNFEMFLKILSPFAPHITEEIWSNFGNKKLLSLENWPKYDPKKILEEKVVYVIQVNGKVRAQFESQKGLSEDEAVKLARNKDEIKKWLEGNQVKRVVFVQDKIINFVL